MFCGKYTLPSTCAGARVVEGRGGAALEIPVPVLARAASLPAHFIKHRKGEQQ